MAHTLRVTQTRSAIGTKPKQRGTLRALGLRRPGHTNDLPDRPEIRGMIAKIPHLIDVEEIEGSPSAANASAAKISAEQPKAAPAADAASASEEEEE